MVKQISDEALFYGELFSTRRALVFALLVNGNCIQDPSGRATSKLFDAATIDLRKQSRAGMIKTLEEDGWIIRDTKAKRTYEIVLCAEHPDVARLRDFYYSEVEKIEEPEDPAPEVIDVVEEETPKAADTSAFDVADALILRMVDILNNPTNEDIQHRLGEQIEECQRLRRRLELAEGEKDELTTRLHASQTRVRALTEEKNQLESNLRAALRQEGVVAGQGLRALERFMQERPRINR